MQVRRALRVDSADASSTRSSAKASGERFNPDNYAAWRSFEVEGWRRTRAHRRRCQRLMVPPEVSLHSRPESNFSALRPSSSLFGLDVDTSMLTEADLAPPRHRRVSR